MNLLELSQTIRKIRQTQKMTVEQLANRSGLSKGFISQVENFRITPSIKSLIKISDALGIEISALFESDTTGEQVTWGNLAEGRLLERNDNEYFGLKYSSLAYNQLGRKMDPFIIEYRPAPPREMLSHEAEEFFVVLAGDIEYRTYDEEHTKIMHAGDTVYIKGNIPHSASVAPGCQFAKALIIYSENNA